MKNNNGFKLLEIIIIIVITGVLSSVATGVIMLNNNILSKENAEIANDKELQEFIDVYETLMNKYYDNIDKKGLLEAAENAMIDYLGDKYTTYLNDEEYGSMIEELSGTYKGIGLTIENNKVISVTKDSPAEKAGILANDVITKINDTFVETLDGESISKLIKDEDSESVRLSVTRDGNIIEFTVEKKELVEPIISYEKLQDTSIGYIYIKNFSKNLKNQMKEALSDLENKERINSLIIDLRDNVGGYLSSAEEVSSLFLSKGKTIYLLETNHGRYTYNDETEEKREYPIIVLLNNNSASASEILAAALKESYGAQIVGTKSYGKGKVQQIASLDSGDTVKYTSAKWLTPSKRCIDGVGISPDYNVEYISGELYDSQLTKAIELLSN